MFEVSVLDENMKEGRKKRKRKKVGWGEENIPAIEWCKIRYVPNDSRLTYL